MASSRGRRTIRASEIGSFVFCQRAWWYQRQDKEPLNREELAAGTNYHRIHLRQARAINLAQMVAWLLIFSALIFLTIWFSTCFIF